MRLGGIACALGLALFGCGSGSTQREPKVAEPSTAPTTTNEASAERTFRSDGYGFDWQLPKDWQFVSPREIGASIHPGIEMVLAGTRTADGPTVLVVLVRDVVAVVPGKQPTLEEDETFTLKWMQSEGIRKTGDEQTKLLGTDALRVDGLKEDSEMSRVTNVAFYRNRRRFDFRCYTAASAHWTPCVRALEGLDIHDMPDRAQASDRPHVLHLRDEKLGVRFDAPDDRWLAVGPRTAARGYQVVWVWANNGRQIDVQVFDLRPKTDMVDEANFAEMMADAERKPGATVVMKRSELSGLPCAHIQIDSPVKGQQDLYLQKRGNFLYGLLVTAQKRDRALLDQALAGLRIGAPN